MGVRNLEFYDRNEARQYPLSDEATARSDDGTRLPSWLLTDVHLRFPSTAGRRAMLGALTVSRRLITATFLACEDPESVESFVPIAAVTLTKPVQPYRQYPVTALYPGTYGWVVMGRVATDSSETAQEFTGKFTLPAQSILLPAAARAYAPQPVQDVAKYGTNAQLTGLVQLLGGNDIEIVKECREVPLYPPGEGTPACSEDTQAREVIVIRLRERVAGLADQANVFDTYRGPCGRRPESQNCGDPEPIEFLAGVQPDCCGNIDVVLRGCASLTRIEETALVDENGDVVESTDACGIIINCGTGLSEACLSPDRLPDQDGNLPNEHENECDEVVSLSLG